MLNFIVVIFLLMVISLIGLFLGMVNPRIVIRWGTLKNRKIVLKVYGSAAIVLFILVLALSPFSKKDMEQIKANKSNIENLATESTPIEPKQNSIDNKFIVKSDLNTTAAIDELYNNAKENSKGTNENDIKEAIKYISDNYNNYWTDNDKMHKILYYGYWLQCIKKDTAQDNKNTIDRAIYQLGTNSVQVVKYVYRNIEKIEDTSTQTNLKEIKKNLDLIPDQYKK